MLASRILSALLVVLLFVTCQEIKSVLRLRGTSGSRCFRVRVNVSAPGKCVGMLAPHILIVSRVALLVFAGQSAENWFPLRGESILIDMLVAGEGSFGVGENFLIKIFFGGSFCCS